MKYRVWIREYKGAGGCPYGQTSYEYTTVEEWASADRLAELLSFNEISNIGEYIEDLQLEPVND